jgi:hypothetical protein
LFAATGLPQFQFGLPPASVAIKCLVIACTATVAHLLIYMAAERASAARRLGPRSRRTERNDMGTGTRTCPHSSGG